MWPPLSLVSERPVAALFACCSVACCGLAAFRLLSRRRRSKLPDTSGLEGARVLVTGATSGIGLAVTEQLAECGRHLELLVACRNEKRAQLLAQRLRRRTPIMTLKCHQVELHNLRSVCRLADELSDGRPLTHVVCNAGVFFAPAALTPDGLQWHAGVNFLSNFCLLRRLIDSGVVLPGRTKLVLVSSQLSARGRPLQAAELGRLEPADVRAYANSKQCLNLLGQYLHNAGVSTVVAFTGGMVATRLFDPAVPRLLLPLTRLLSDLLLRSADETACDIVRLCCEADTLSGSVYSVGKRLDWPLRLPENDLHRLMDDFAGVVDSIVGERRSRTPP